MSGCLESIIIYLSGTYNPVSLIRFRRYYRLW